MLPTCFAMLFAFISTTHLALTSRADEQDNYAPLQRVVPHENAISLVRRLTTTTTTGANSSQIETGPSWVDSIARRFRLVVM